MGVDNKGSPWQRASGVIAGDRESYHVFAPLFDPIIDEYHGHGKLSFHPRDMDSRKIVEGDVNNSHLLSVQLYTRRSIHGFSLPAACSRGERRTLEGILRLVFKRMGGKTFSKQLDEVYHKIAICAVGKVRSAPPPPKIENGRARRPTRPAFISGFCSMK